MTWLGAVRPIRDRWVGGGLGWVGKSLPFGRSLWGRIKNFQNKSGRPSIYVSLCYELRRECCGCHLGLLGEMSDGAS